MKKIMFMLLILIAGMTVWGSVIVVYASSSRASVPQPTPTPTPAQTKNVVDRQATLPPQMQGRVFAQGSSNLPEIALTFDDGPSPVYTAQVLAILQQYGVHATFFTIGQQVREYPGLVQQEYNAGNVVGNHSWNHPDLTTLSSDDVQSQLSSTSSAIQQAIGVQPTLFRPPYGSINMRVQTQAAQLGLTSVLWTVDPRDWQRPGSDVIVNRVLSAAFNGHIVLMHDGGGNRSQTVAALPTIITTLQQRGFQLVTVQQMIDDTQKSGSTQ